MILLKTMIIWQDSMHRARISKHGSIEFISKSDEPVEPIWKSKLKGAENQNFAVQKFASVRKTFEYEMTWLLGEFYYAVIIVGVFVGKSLLRIFVPLSGNMRRVWF